MVKFNKLILDGAAWNKYYDSIVAEYANKCHTMKRFDCYENIKSKKLSEVQSNERKTIAKHLFYDAPDCVVKIFGASGYVATGVFALISALVIMF